MRPGQMRRQARRIRRYGFQPMMFTSPGDPLPESAAVAVARVVWRYRPELAPLALALLTFTTAAVMHHAHRGAWPFIAAASAAIAAVLAAPPP